MIFSTNTVVVLMTALSLAMTGMSDAARAKKNNAGAHLVSGMVMNHNKRAVAAAHVHVAHKHRARAVKLAKGVKANAAKPKSARAHAHGGVMSAANGSFRLAHHHSGVVRLVAHKKGEGIGHAKTSGNASGVVIRLHKRHRHHGK